MQYVNIKHVFVIFKNKAFNGRVISGNNHKELASLFLFFLLLNMEQTMKYKRILWLLTSVRYSELYIFIAGKYHLYRRELSNTQGKFFYKYPIARVVNFP